MEEDSRSTNGDSDELTSLLRLAEVVCHNGSNQAKRHALESMCIVLRPQMPQDDRNTFMKRALEMGVVEAAALLLDQIDTELACSAVDLLGHMAFNSDLAAKAVLAEFPRLEKRFRQIFADQELMQPRVLEAATLVCANLAAVCPWGHRQFLPLVQNTCLKIIAHPSVSDQIRGTTILLLANMSMTVGPELRALRVADPLLKMLVERKTSDQGKSVAESVVIFLHGHERCEEIDQLMALNVIEEYCLPIMEKALSGDEFRGIYPHLVYSVRLFQVLAQCRDYAEMVTTHPKVVPMLLQVCRKGSAIVNSDLEGRRLALEALWSFAREGLWPPTRSDADPSARREADDFFTTTLPGLLCHDSRGIRGTAAGLWACAHRKDVLQQLLIGSRVEAQHCLPNGFWKSLIMSGLFPFLSEEPSSDLDKF